MVSRFQLAGLVLTGLLLGACASGPFPDPSRGSPQAEQDELQLARDQYQHGSYDQAIDVLRRVLEQRPGPEAYEAHWLLAESYEAHGDVQAALKEYQLVRKNFPQTAHGTDALQKMQLLQLKQPASTETVPVAARLPSREYRLGEEDEVAISVYGDEELSKTQTVRPDGKIAFPLIGDLRAAGLTPDELREQLTQSLSKYLKSPRVTVLVSQYNSRQVYVLGQVKTPGVLRLSSDISLLQGIARAGGMTDEADLQGALLVREAQVLPVNFERLLRNGDFSQNVALQPNDAILVPNVSAKKIFVLGEVKQPLAIPLRHSVSLVESLSMAGGFTRDAEPKSVAIIRGGLGSRNMLTVNINEITKNALTAKNLMLQPNDIVYVPKSFIADVDRFFEHVAKIISPVVLTEFGIALYPTIKSVITTGQGPSTVLIPQPSSP